MATGHTSAPWNPYSTFGHLVERSGGKGIHLSPEDYDHAAKCVNAHDALVVALSGCLDALNVAIERSEGDTFGVQHNNVVDSMAAAEAALKLARGES